MPFAVYALALAAFSVGTAEFIISGLLPSLSADLGTTIPIAGLLVSAYAAGVAIVSPIIATFTAHIPRRTMLLGVLLTFFIGQVLCALAPNYAVLLAARLLVAFAHGVFFGVSLIIIDALIPAHRHGRAFALFFGGLTLATILGVPGGTAIGLAFGWRTTFWFVGALSGLATLAVALLVPRKGTDGDGLTAIGPQLRQLAKQEIYLSYLLIAFNALGFFAFVTYQVPMLRDVTGIGPDRIPVFLLIAGIGTVAGTVLSGRLADWKLMPALIGTILVQAVVLAAISVIARDPLLMAVGLFINGAAFGAFATPIQARIVAAAKAAPSLASTLISTAFNAGIAGGALAGSLLLSAGAGYTILPALAAGCSLAAALVAILSWRLDSRT